MSSLPDTILKAWEPDTQAKVGGFMEMAGIDPVAAFMPKGIKDHDWLGWRVELPGIGTGKIIRSIIHPRGKIMFDLEYDDPVPVVWRCGEGVEVPFKDRPDRHETVHRYYGTELLEILSIMGGTAHPPA